jgi:hypothetical protein
MSSQRFGSIEALRQRASYTSSGIVGSANFLLFSLGRSMFLRPRHVLARVAVSFLVVTSTLKAMKEQTGYFRAKLQPILSASSVKKINCLMLYHRH